MFGRGKKKKSAKETKATKQKKEADMEAIVDTTKDVVKSTEPKTKFTPYQPATDEKYMNEKQCEHFRNILNTWKLELMQEVDETISELKEASTSVLADPNDRATQEETFSLELRTRDRERKLIKKIEEALQKIKDKDYGYCDACGIEIGIRRLEARPTANLCIDCKTLAEIQEKRS